MRFKTLFHFFIGLLLSSCSSSFNQPITSFQVQTPRPFGYVIGDEIKQRIIIDARKGLALQYSSLPGKGEINRWLNLNKINIIKSTTREGIRYQIDLRYQLFYAPLQVKMLEIPGFSLQFRQFGYNIEQKVPLWYFTAAPLRELAIRKDDGKQYMRPDTPAPLLDNTAQLHRLIVSLLIAFMLMIYLAWLYGLFTFLPKYQLFKRPSRRLAKAADDVSDMLNIMHKALNQLNGKPLFQHRLTDFYQRFPNYQQLHSELIWFFNCSNRHFFSSVKRAHKEDGDKIKALCRQCLLIERGMR